MGRRLALLIATYDYQDTGLRRLAAPAHDAEALAEVLRDPAIAGFEVTTMVNEPHHRIGEAIGDFYRDRRRDDLTLLYFTGHGLKDDNGLLYLAMTNTRRDSLLFTALSAEQIDQAMEGCVSRQKVLILDCCYSGAFPAGRISKADTAVHALERFQGRGRTVLTASDATQYSFEGNQAHGQAVQSVFTRYLVQGLRDGSADLDGDGDITLDELYGYVHDRVVDEMPQQRPKKQDNVEGRIVIARNINWSLPAHLRHALGSPIATDRLGAVDGLAHLHRIGNDLVRRHALDGLQGLVDDDSRLVSAAAAERVRALQPISPETLAEQHGLEPGPTEPVAQERAPEPPPPTPPPQASRPVQHPEGSPVPSRPLARSAPPTAPSVRTPTATARWASRLIPRTPRGRAITAGFAVLVAVVVAVLAFGPGLLADFSDGSGSSDSTGAPKIVLDRASAVLTVRSSASGSVNDLAFSPNGKTLAAVSNGDRAIQLWDSATHRSLTSITTTSKAVTSVAFSPDGKTLAAGTTNGLGTGGNAQVWQLPAGDSVATTTGHTEAVAGVALSPDGKILATGDWDGTARLWDAATGKLLTTLIRVQGDWPRCVCSVAFSPDGKTLATGSTDKTVRLWDVADRKLRRVLTGHTYGVNTLAFSPDGRTLASGSIDGTIRLWNVATGKPLGTLQRDPRSVSSNVTGVAFDPKDGNILASVGDNGENRLLLWNVTTHKVITQFTASERGLSSVAWSPDGRTIATGDGDKAKVRLWDVARVKAGS
ncbi:caspase family protein [Streptomyces sp. NBC_00989]|uniref:caspase, EACC1-associated type n=1 Tax=Streptomyces sp. NBC_00989 TaxID=2903705 RepID=UPI00386FCA07|nr:caspase family protein [Streptomyces sp. NBC_00989]